MILFVCTGNICRSAMGEILFRHHLKNTGIDIETASCGVLAWDGAPITRDALKVLEEAGISNIEHTSTAITSELIKQASLVVAMTRDHAGGIISRHPPAREYTFLAGEILRYIKKHPLIQMSEKQNTEGSAEGLRNQPVIFRDWIKSLNQIRSEAFSPSARAKGTVLGLAGDEVSDPAIGSLEDHRKVFQTVNELAKLLVENLKSLNSA